MLLEMFLGAPVGSIPKLLFSITPIKKLFSEKKFQDAIVQEIQLPSSQKPPIELQEDSKKLLSVSLGPIQYSLKVGQNTWIFRLHWQEQVSDANWMELTFPQDNEIDIFLNISNSFFSDFLEDGKYLELLQKFVIALSLAEKLARITSKNGMIYAGDIRTSMNTVLRKASELARSDGKQ